VHPFFQVLQQTLRGARLAPELPQGSILFRVQGLSEERWQVELGSDNCQLLQADADEGDLTLFCDREQLDTMLREGWAPRPLRWSGRRELLDALASVAQPPRSSVDLRASLAREEP